MAKLAHFSTGTSVQRQPDVRRTPSVVRQGRVVRIDSEGQVFVDFPGNPSKPVAAKLAVSDVEIAGLIEGDNGAEILLVFQDNDLAQPIIVGKLRERVPTSGVEINVRGRRFTVDTEEEVELRCGQAKLRIRRDGKVIVLGDEVVSRARRSNRIKGGTVNIN